MELKLFQNRAWDALSPVELRMVATAMTEAAESGGYSLESVFLRMLVSVNDLDVLYTNSEPNEEGVLEPVYWVRERKKDAIPFTIPLYALQFWVKPKKDGGGGCLDWLIAGSQRTISPEVPRSNRWFGRLFSLPRGFAAPAHLMSDVKWQHYRAISDYFEQWVKIDNAVRRARFSAAAPSSDKPKQPSSLAGPKGDELLAKARAQWLAAIFCRRTLHRDRQRGTLTYSFSYRPGQAVRNQKYFLHVSPVDFQMLLFWWEGMQHWLRRKYPKCFRQGGGGGKDKQDPLSLYSRSIATLEKFTGSDEETINQKTYTVILQQFNDMVEQNEEYEKMKH